MPNSESVPGVWSYMRFKIALRMVDLSYFDVSLYNSASNDMLSCDAANTDATKSFKITAYSLPKRIQNLF